MEQQLVPKPLSSVINAASLSSFFSSNPSHLEIFNTLLESRVIGVDSEIRTERENDNIIRFPVLTLCLDGLDRLLEKHELAKQSIQGKVYAGANPSARGKLIQNLPVTRMGFLTASKTREDLEALKRRMEDENSRELARMKTKLQAEYDIPHICP